MSGEIVLRHLKPILTFVCLNKLVIFRTRGEQNVKFLHSVLFSEFLVGVVLLFYEYLLF